MDPNPPADDMNAAQQATDSTTISQDDRNMGVLCHVLGLLTSVVGPLVVWLIMKEKSAFVDYHGKQAVNFNITMLICYMISMALYAIFCIGVFTFLITFIVHLVFGIVAAIKAYQGEYYVIPAAIPLIK